MTRTTPVESPVDDDVDTPAAETAAPAAAPASLPDAMPLPSASGGESTTPIWDELAPRWEKVKALQSEEVAGATA